MKTGINAMKKNTKKVRLTDRGVHVFQLRLATVRHAHAKICDDRKTAHELSGDGWHDNPYFNYLQQLEANKTWKINELEQIIANSIQISVVEGKRPIFSVNIGSIVLIGIENESTGEYKEQLVEIVGYEESVPACGMVSYTAPLGKALLGLREGDARDLPG